MPVESCLRLVNVLINDVIDNYTEYFELALLNEHKILYLSEEANKLQRQGYDTKEINKIITELLDVYVDDLDAFFSSPFFLSVCSILGWDYSGKCVEAKKIAWSRVNITQVKEQAWIEAKGILLKIVSGRVV